MGAIKITISDPFTNEHLSVSRIKKAENCMLAFKGRYIDDIDDPSGEAALFGKLLHSCLEAIFRWVIDEEHSGPIGDELIIRTFRDAFEQSEAVGTATYKEGIELVRSYFRMYPHADHSSVLAVEQPFLLTVESDDGKTVFDILGYIDRVDRLQQRNAIRVVDYKSSRMMFTREDLDTDLQMSIYGLAVKTLWPWVESVDYAFDMLRHKTRQRARRTPEQLNEAADYIIAMGRRIESALEFPPKLNPLCGWCSVRHDCPEYQDAIKSGPSRLSYLIAAGDLEKVAAERNQAAALEKIAKRRKSEMDEILLARMAHTEEGELVIGDTRFKPAQKTNVTYPEEKTIGALADALGVDPEFVRRRIMVVENGRVDKLINAANLGRGKKQLLKAKLATIAERNKNRPYVSARKLNERKAK